MKHAHSRHFNYFHSHTHNFKIFQHFIFFNPKAIKDSTFSSHFFMNTKKFFISSLANFSCNSHVSVEEGEKSPSLLVVLVHLLLIEGFESTFLHPRLHDSIQARWNSNASVYSLLKKSKKMNLCMCVRSASTVDYA